MPSSLKNIIQGMVIYMTMSMTVNACDIPEYLDQEFLIKGVAQSSDGNILYEEILIQEPGSSGGKLHVSYSAPDGAVLATKIVDYNCNPTTPSFKLLDKTTGEVEGVKWSIDNIESYQDDQNTIIEHPNSQYIIDAGFDNAIKLKWDELIEGQQIVFDYLFARKNRFLKLRFEKSTAPLVVNGESKPTDIFFKVVPNNMILRAISSPIFVGYNKYSRELRYYIGPTNLPMHVGDEKVIIRYEKLASL